MDIESDFRSLLSNQYCSYELYRRRYAFKAVFYKSRYTGIYCCCPCVFDNEFLNYISDDGEISKEILDQVIQNILNGNCPHVDNVPAEYVKETGVNGAHIAAAAGTPGKLREVSEIYVLLKTSIFQLDPFMVGVSKKNFRGLAQFYTLYTQYFGLIHSHTYSPMFIAKKNDSTSANAVKIEATSIVAFCLEHESLQLLKDVMVDPMVRELTELVKCLGSDNKSEIPREFFSFLLWFADGKNIREHQFSIFSGQAVSETALVTGNIKIVKELHKIDYNELFGRNYWATDMRYGASVYLAQMAIVYDQPDSLNALFGEMSDRDELQTNDYTLGELCLVLQRRKCQRVLLENRINTPEPETLSLVKKAKILYHILDTVYNCDKQEIEKLLKGLMKINEYDRTMLQSYIKESRIIDIRIVHLLLELDARIDCVNAGENTHLTDLLRRMRVENFSSARGVVELLLYENFDWDLNKTAVEEGLELDAAMLDGTSKIRNVQDVDITGEYITDSKLHCYFKCNVLETLSFEFYGPLLIECGFPYTKDIISKYLDRQIHSWEHEYLQKCIYKTRSLKLICRDCVRRHFKRKIRRFVESSGLPESLKDFILLKRELMTLQ